VFVDHLSRFDTVRADGAVIWPLRLRIPTFREADGSLVRGQQDVFLLEAKPELGFVLAIDEMPGIGFVRCSITMEDFAENEIGVVPERVGIDANRLQDAV
jgi:hypothetical protein